MANTVQVLLVQAQGGSSMTLLDAETRQPIADVRGWHADLQDTDGVLYGDLRFIVGPQGVAPWTPGVHMFRWPKWRFELAVSIASHPASLTPPKPRP